MSVQCGEATQLRCSMNGPLLMCWCSLVEAIDSHRISPGWAWVKNHQLMVLVGEEEFKIGLDCETSLFGNGSWMWTFCFVKFHTHCKRFWWADLILGVFFGFCQEWSTMGDSHQVGVRLEGIYKDWHLRPNIPPAAKAKQIFGILNTK